MTVFCVFIFELFRVRALEVCEGLTSNKTNVDKRRYIYGMRLAVECQAPKHICFTACLALAGLKEKEEECVIVCYLLALHAYSFLNT